MKKKKLKKYRFINNIQFLNKIIIHEIDMSLTINEFSKDFVEYLIIFMIDYYSEYFQLSLDKDSRDYTTFLTDLGLVRNTRLPQD